MKNFFQTHKKLHIWLLADIGLLLAFFLLRGQKGLMNAVADHFTGPLRRGLGKVCYLVPFSVMEAVEVLAVLFGAGYVIWNVRAVARAKDGRRDRAYGAALGAACILLSVWAGFCLLWGVNYWTDSFQDKSGIYAQPVALEDLREVTAFFADRVSEMAGDVRRDGHGLFAVPREEILANSVRAYDGLTEAFPFLAFDDPGVKPMAFSRLMSALDFTGFYSSFTGESNVNVDSPACMLPSTIAHELAHQRGAGVQFPGGAGLHHLHRPGLSVLRLADRVCVPGQRPVLPGPGGLLGHPGDPCGGGAAGPGVQQRLLGPIPEHSGPEGQQQGL